MVRRAKELLVQRLLLERCKGVVVGLQKVSVSFKQL